MMLLGLWIVAGGMVVVALTGVALFLWGWKNGQFRDIEEAKFRMLDDKEPQPWPDHKREAP